MGRQFFKAIADDGDYVFLNADAETYFDALVVAGFTEVQSISLYALDFNEIKEAIDIFFIALVDDGIFVAMVGMYLFIGGTAATHAINAADPGTFDLLFQNSPTHSATGTDWNGTTQFARTGIVPSVDLTLNDTHLSYYSRDNINENKFEWGTFDGSSNELMMAVSFANNFFFRSYNTAGGQLLVSEGFSDNFFLGTRISAVDARGFRGVGQIGAIVTSGGSLPTTELYLAVRNLTGSAQAGTFSSKECAFASTGLNIPSAKAFNFMTAVQDLQTTLGGRNV